MHRIGFTFLLLIGPCAWAQTRWSRQIYNTRLPIVRERRQFSAGDWIPLTQPCPTCRPLTDPVEAGSKQDDIGLVPPKLPRQIQSTGFFPQDEGSILSVPPPPSFNNRQPAGQFQNYFQFPPQQNPFPQQQFFPPAQQNQFLQPTYLNNQFFNNPQVPLLFNNPVLGQQNVNQKPAPKPALKDPKAPENVVLGQNKRPQEPVTRLELPTQNAPAQFLQQPQTILLNPTDSFLVPPPNKSLTVPQNIEIPGLEKEEIQLLYVPVETLRQRGFQQEQRQPQNYQHLPQQFVQLNQNLVRPAGGHFITQAPVAPPQPPQTTTLKQVPVTPPTFALHSLPVQQTAQPFLSASPETLSTQFATAAPLTQEYSPLTTENEPERVVTIPARPTPQPSSTFFPSTPKPVSNHLTETLHNDVYNDKALTDQKQDFLRNQFEIQTQSTTEAPSTTLAPHQPPLSVFMGSDDGEVKVVDVLRALKDAKTIPVLDHLSRSTPKVFVGPANLSPPRGYGKFELPYLSNIDTNRVERKVERLPFFVAPLNFNPPPGYSKIPFPAPHIGSVVVSSESAMRSALLHDKGSTTLPEEYFSANLPSVNPELPGLINELETETTTTPLPETTSQRVRSRRPNNAYRPPGRRPVPNSRFRTTTPPAETEDPAQNVQNAEILREVDEKKERFRNNYLKPRRQRVKTTTEAVPENHQTEASYTENSYVPTENHQTQRSDVTEQHIQPEEQQLNNQQYQYQGFNNQQPDFLAQFDPFQQISSPQPVYDEERREVQGLFEVKQPQGSDFLTVNNNGDSGFFDHGFVAPTEQPFSSTQFVDQSSTFGSSTQEPQTSEVTKSAEEEVTEKTVEIPKQHFRHSLPNVPGVKSVPNPSSVKSKSPVRSRPRGRLTFQTSQTTESTTTRRHSDEYEQEPTSTRRYNPRGTRKPLRTTTTTTESSSSTEPHTLRPSRRSGVRTSVSTKRIRKPTTPTPEVDYDSTDAAFGRKSGPEYSPSGVSNDVYDDQIGHSSIGSKSKKKYEESHTYSTPGSVSTKTYQSRKDEDDETKTTYPEWNPSESGLDISGISLTTEPSVEDSAEEKKKQETSKKAFDPELEKKNGRRRIRVRVHKRPHDNFETAESQNVGTVANVLVPPTPSKPNEEQPDLYLFSSDKDFSFEASGKFAGTKNKEHVRNITSDILENTFTFSAPGVDNKTELQQKVTIVSEDKTTKTTTEMSTSRGDDTDKTDPPTTTETFETTTDSVVPETTEPEITTTETPTKVQHSRIIKTSTSTQVSHETEICYKGKCIKTNSESPEKDLKLLVETANTEEENSRT